MAIDSFSGEYRFLSNFYPSVIVGGYRGDNVVAPSVEHAYQAFKAERKADRDRILLAGSAAIAKRMGRTVKLRPDWEEVKLRIMTNLVRTKFLQNPALGDKLLATGDEELIEGNHWGDTFWGVCRGEGENHLGRILMEVRKFLRETGAHRESA